MPISVIALSGSTNGLPIEITDSATPGQTVHTCTNPATERVFLFASNHGAAPVLITVEVGGTTLPIQKTVPNQVGEYPILEGFVNVDAATDIDVFGGDGTSLAVHGYVIQET